MTLTLTRPSQIHVEKPSTSDLEQKVPRDGYDRPMVVPPEGGKPVAHTRVTTFIDVLDDKSNIADWKTRSALIGAAKQPPILDQIRKLDPETDKRQLNAIAERMVDLSGANEKRDKGTHLHWLSEFIDRGEQLPPVVISDLADMMAYQAMTLTFTFSRIEMFLVNSILRAAGTTDRIGETTIPDPDGVVGGPRIVDLKTGRTDYGQLKMCMQLATYSRSAIYDFTAFPAPDRIEEKRAWEKWKKTEFTAEEAVAAYKPLEVNQDWGIIIHLPSGSAEVQLYWADLNLGWEASQEAIRVRELRKKKKVLIPFG